MLLCFEEQFRENACVAGSGQFADVEDLHPKRCVRMSAGGEIARQGVSVFGVLELDAAGQCLWAPEELYAGQAHAVVVEFNDSFGQSRVLATSSDDGYLTS